MYKPFFDVSEMFDWNLAHVNAYKTKIKIGDGNMAQIEVDTKMFESVQTAYNL